MPWTENDTIPSMRNRSSKARKAFAEVANAALERGLTEEEAIFAGIAAADRADGKTPVKRIHKVQPKIPLHLKAVLELQKNQQEEKQAIHRAFLPKNSLSTNQDRNVISAEWGSRGELILVFDTGERLVTSPVPVSENIEQYISISNVSESSSSSSQDDEGDAAYQYNSSGYVSRIDYSSGNYKIFVYDSSGVLIRVDYHKGAVIYRRTFTYDIDGNLISVTNTIIS